MFAKHPFNCQCSKPGIVQGVQTTPGEVVAVFSHGFSSSPAREELGLLLYHGSNPGWSRGLKAAAPTPVSLGCSLGRLTGEAGIWASPASAWEGSPKPWPGTLGNNRGRQGLCSDKGKSQWVISSSTYGHLLLGETFQLWYLESADASVL